MTTVDAFMAAKALQLGIRQIVLRAITVMRLRILYEGLGVALKISDGSARARSSAMLKILDLLGVLSKGKKNNSLHL